MAQDTVLGKVWRGELPSYPVYRFNGAPGAGGGLLAILDIFPATNGHVLILSEEPAEKWTELANTRLQQAAVLGAFVARRQEEVLGARGVVRATFGDQVPRFHDHCIPSYADGDVIRRMHPGSGRMDAMAPREELFATQQRLAFPAELAAQADAELAQIATRAVLL